MDDFTGSEPQEIQVSAEWETLSDIPDLEGASEPGVALNSMVSEEGSKRGTPLSPIEPEEESAFEATLSPRVEEEERLAR